MKKQVKFNYEVFNKVTETSYFQNSIEVSNNKDAFNEVEKFFFEKFGSNYDLKFNHAGKTVILNEIQN